MTTICEVGPRDGLQSERVELSPRRRAELIERLAAAGLRRIEIGSFVDPRAVPAMAGTEELLELLAVPEGVALTALVLNRKGYERLAATPLGEVRFALTASDSFTRHNTGMGLAEAAEQATEVLRRAGEDGRRTSLTIGTAFGCPFEGRVDPAAVVELAETVAVAGLDELVLADTIGAAVPAQVGGLLPLVEGIAPSLGIHLHNTRNGGYANALAAVEAGVDVLDAAVGGCGGCPFAPRAGGNVATEDLAYLLEREGVSTGLDLEALATVAEWLGGLLGHPLDGRLHRARPWWPDLRAETGSMLAAAGDQRAAGDGGVDRAAFRDVIGRFVSGVTVISARTADEDRGTTASALCSLSLEPPMLLACLNESSDTQAAISESGRFAISVLGDEQLELARRFATKGRGKFDDVDVERGRTGAPLLAGALAQIECLVAETARGGTHVVFLAEVLGCRGRDGSPLTYFRGAFGHFRPHTGAVR